MYELSNKFQLGEYRERMDRVRKNKPAIGVKKVGVILLNNDTFF